MGSWFNSDEVGCYSTNHKFNSGLYHSSRSWLNGDEVGCKALITSSIMGYSTQHRFNYLQGDVSGHEDVELWRHLEVVIKRLHT